MCNTVIIIEKQRETNGRAKVPASKAPAKPKGAKADLPRLSALERPRERRDLAHRALQQCAVRALAAPAGLLLAQPAGERGDGVQGLGQAELAKKKQERME